MEPVQYTQRRECENEKNDSHTHTQELTYTCTVHTYMLSSSMQQVCLPVGMNEKNPHCIETETYGRLLACTRWFFYQFSASSSLNHYNDSWNSAEMVIMLLQNHRTSTVNAQPTHLLAGSLDEHGKSAHLKVLRMKVNSFRLFSHHGKFLFHYKYMNCHCCVYAFNAPRGNIDCNLWTKLKQKKQNRTNRQHSWDYTAFFLLFSWSLK